MVPSNIGIAFLQVVNKKLTRENRPGPFEIAVNKFEFPTQLHRFASIYISKDTPITLVGLASSWRNDTILPAPGKGTNGIVTQAAVPTANHLSALSAVAIREKDWLTAFQACWFSRSRTTINSP